MFQKKSLGQNFLRSGKALTDILDASGIHADDIVLEVGPGEGVLTEKLLSFAFKVIAIEKDARLIPILKDRFKNEIAQGKLDLVELDALDFDPVAYGLEPRAYKVVANIPYYITGAFLRKFLGAPCQPAHMVLLLQKEVADRIVAQDKKESLLSLSVKAYGTPRRVSIVKAGSFVPAPQVDSAILSISEISKKNFETLSEEVFFSLLKKAFTQKRKMLRSSLNLDEGVFRSCDINPKGRGEDLSLGQWLCLAKASSN